MMFVAILAAAAAATASPSPPTPAASVSASVPTAAASTPPSAPASVATPSAAATSAPPPIATAVPTPTPIAARPAAVAIVWHLGPAPYADDAIRAAAIALAAPDALGPQLRALRAHPRARFSLAIDAGVVDDLNRAAAGDTALQAMATGRLGGARLDEMLRLLAQVPVLDVRLAATSAARRYRALTTSSHLTTQDYVDLVGFAALVRLAAAGELSPDAPQLHASALTAGEVTEALAQLAQADAKIVDALKSAASGGQLELLADPAGEPILPLLIDGGGKSGPNVVVIGAQADAAYLVDAALHGIGALAPGASPGVYAPHGAYDDKTATVLEQHHAAFALFSDRVLRTSPIGGSRAAVAAADAAALHAFALRAAAGPALATLFWSEDDGSALDVLSPRLPASAMGARVLELARNAGARGGDGSVIVLRIDAQGLWDRRPDRAQVVDDLAAALASGAVTSVTVGQYVRATPPPAISYGFSPASDEGSLAYWMGTSNQASMWNALGDARRAAGGDAAISRDPTRTPLLEAEASRWYAVPTMIAPAAEIGRLIDHFRAAISAIYRGAGRPVPAIIAPLRIEVPAATPRPSR
jgi:hypothetical protein